MQVRAGEMVQNRSRSEGPGEDWGDRVGADAGKEMRGLQMFSSDCFPAFWELGNEISAARWCDN